MMEAPRLGACRSFGRLLAQAEADYMVFSDQDDVWLPGRISTPLAQIKAAEKKLGVGTPLLAHTDLMVVDENLRSIAPSFWSYSNLNPYGGSRLNRLLMQNVVTGSATMVNRALARLASPIPPGSRVTRLVVGPGRLGVRSHRGHSGKDGPLPATRQQHSGRHVLRLALCDAPHDAGSLSRGPRRRVFAVPRGKRWHFWNVSVRACCRGRKPRSTPL